jgi:hypothetical protein
MTLKDKGSIKGMMFHVGDEMQHTLCWSEFGNGWIIENPLHGAIREVGTPNPPKVWSFFALAALELEMKLGIPAHKWTVTDNPYGRD